MIHFVSIRSHCVKKLQGSVLIIKHIQSDYTAGVALNRKLAPQPLEVEVFLLNGPDTAEHSGILDAGSHLFFFSTGCRSLLKK